jgi:hypothetical protein
VPNENLVFVSQSSALIHMSETLLQPGLAHPGSYGTQVDSSSHSKLGLYSPGSSQDTSFSSAATLTVEDVNELKKEMRLVHESIACLKQELPTVCSQVYFRCKLTKLSIM